jgi:peptide subunit release factor 1 (eRF1)
MLAIGAWISGRRGIDVVNRELCSLLQKRRRGAVCARRFSQERAMLAIGAWVGGRCGIDVMNRELCSLLQKRRRGAACARRFS